MTGPELCPARWPNLGPAGGIWQCTLNVGHVGDHEARGVGGAPLLASPSSIIPQDDDAILPEDYLRGGAQ